MKRIMNKNHNVKFNTVNFTKQCERNQRNNFKTNLNQILNSECQNPAECNAPKQK